MGCPWIVFIYVFLIAWLRFCTKAKTCIKQYNRDKFNCIWSFSFHEDPSTICRVVTGTWRYRNGLGTCLMASNKNEYQWCLLGHRSSSRGRGKFTGGRCVGLTTLPPLCANYLEILGASTCRSPKGLSRPVQGQLYVFDDNDSSQMLWTTFRSSLVPLFVMFLLKRKLFKGTCVFWSWHS